MDQNPLSSLKKLKQQLKSEQEEAKAKAKAEALKPTITQQESFDQAYSAPKGADEENLRFGEVVQGVKRLDNQDSVSLSAEQKLARLRPNQARQLGATGDALISSSAGPVDSALVLSTPVGADTQLSFKTATLQQGVFKQLKKGELEPVFVLDLHGINSEEAYVEVNLMLSALVRESNRVGQIIHGKGVHAILKNHVKLWLEQHPSVLAFCSAPTQFGGSGSVLVLVKKG